MIRAQERPQKQVVLSTLAQKLLAAMLAQTKPAKYHLQASLERLDRLRIEITAIVQVCHAQSAQ